MYEAEHLYIHSGVIMCTLLFTGIPRLVDPLRFVSFFIFFVDDLGISNVPLTEAEKVVMGAKLSRYVCLVVDEVDHI